MPALNERPSQESGYFLDAENAAELARLIRQARQITETIGLFPSPADLERSQNILDLGCGPGEWALSVARHNPASQVFGVDIGQLMIEYARTSAQMQQINNAHFRVMDIRQPLDFAPASFDLVHSRLIGASLTTQDWPSLLSECFRVLQPGSILASSEVDSLGVNTSPSLTRYNALLIRAMRLAGQCFAPDGDQGGITAVHVRLLQQAGFEQIQQKAFVFNYSAGMPLHTGAYENTSTLMKLSQPFLVNLGIATQEEVEMLYHRALTEISSDDFCGVAFYQTVWGRKPM